MEALECRTRRRRARRDCPLKGGQLQILVGAVTPELVDESRRGEQIGARIILERLVEALRIGLGWPARVHVRDHRGHAECRTEQREEREGRQIALSLLDAVYVPERLHLCREDPERRHDPLGYAGAPTRE